MSNEVLRAANYIIDADLQLEDGAAAITADGVGSAILDLGNARMVGDVVIDVSAIDHTTDDEQYHIYARYSSSATFASDIEAGQALLLQSAGVGIAGGDVDPDAGRYILPVTNVINDREYRYMQLYVDVAGTTPSITFKAWLSKSKPQ